MADLVRRVRPRATPIQIRGALQDFFTNRTSKKKGVCVDHGCLSAQSPCRRGGVPCVMACAHGSRFSMCSLSPPLPPPLPVPCLDNPAASNNNISLKVFKSALKKVNTPQEGKPSILGRRPLVPLWQEVLLVVFFLNCLEVNLPQPVASLGPAMKAFMLTTAITAADLAAAAAFKASKAWCKGFWKRHPEIKRKSPSAVASTR